MGMWLIYAELSSFCRGNSVPNQPTWRGEDSDETGAEDSRVFDKKCPFIYGWLQIQIQKDSKSMGLTEVD